MVWTLHWLNAATTPRFQPAPKPAKAKSPYPPTELTLAGRLFKSAEACKPISESDLKLMPAQRSPALHPPPPAHSPESTTLHTNPPQSTTIHHSFSTPGLAHKKLRKPLNINILRDTLQPQLPPIHHNSPLEIRFSTTRTVGHARFRGLRLPRIPARLLGRTPCRFPPGSPGSRRRTRRVGALLRESGIGGETSIEERFCARPRPRDFFSKRSVDTPGTHSIFGFDLAVDRDTKHHRTPELLRREGGVGGCFFHFRPK